jgi:hypothetical protein
MENDNKMQRLRAVGCEAGTLVRVLYSVKEATVHEGYKGCRKGFRKVG